MLGRSGGIRHYDIIKSKVTTGLSRNHIIQSFGKFLIDKIEDFLSTTIHVLVEVTR